MTLRAATPDDIPALATLEAASFSTDQLAVRHFRRFLRCGNCTMLVAEESGALAGYVLVLYRSNSRAARIYSIAVSGSFRGRGIGERLLEQAEQAAHRRGSNVMRLEVRPDNRAAIGMYEKNGYRRFGMFPAFYEDGTDALRLEKALGEKTA